jgi:very-short-patch-repair endonuclease
MARRFALPGTKDSSHVILPSGKDAFIDFAYPQAMLAIEVDVRITHSKLLDRECDYARQAELVAAGWRNSEIYVAPDKAQARVGGRTDRRRRRNRSVGARKPGLN